MSVYLSGNNMSIATINYHLVSMETEIQGKCEEVSVQLNKLRTLCDVWNETTDMILLFSHSNVLFWK